MVQMNDVKRALGIPIYNPTDQEILDAIAGVDEPAIRADVETIYTTAIWDQVSPINGVPAADMLARPDVPAGGVISLVLINGAVSVFQPHDPEGPIEPMTEAEAQTVITSIRQTLVDAHVASLVLKEAVETITSPPTP